MLLIIWGVINSLAHMPIADDNNFTMYGMKGRGDQYFIEYTSQLYNGAHETIRMSGEVLKPNYDVH